SGKGVSRCKIKREKKALRTQYKGRRKRKDDLYSLLVDFGLVSKVPDEQFIQQIDRELLKTFPKENYRHIAHIIPYLYRKKALDTPLTKEELARTIIHLAQRRGYLSNRKQELKDESSGIVLDGIKKLKDAIRESNCRTLGEYFCTVDPEENRIRNTHTERSMYQEEFRMICQAQRHIISEEMEKQLYHTIFHQRPLKSCKHLIGRCRVYQELPKCPYTKDEAQLFRIITTVQNLRIEKEGVIRSLSEDERKEAIEFLNGFSSLFKKNGKIALAKLQKVLKLEKKEKFTLADDEKEIYGNELNNILFRAFGEKASRISQTDKGKFFNDLQSIRKTEVLLKRLVEYWKLSPETAKDIAGTSMPDDYCAFSLKALKEILPELMSGIDLNTVLKLKYPESNSCNLLDTLPLVDKCGIELRNPVVHRVLTELRRVVNAVIARYGKPDRIRIELARDLKATNKEREKMTRTIREKEKERMIIAERIVKEAGIPSPSRDDITKVLLAEECNFQCPYSGKQLNMRTLFDGTVEIEHIIPYSRSFDNSFANKTLCVREYNDKKGNRTPFEAFGGSSEYKEMLARVKQFKGAYAECKLELFEKEEIEEEKLLNRNLNDTRYASRLAMQYLALLYGGIVDKEGRQRIFASSGSCTALMRSAWGGNYLLGEGEKVRSDHRHHAIDALTIALTTPKLVKKIASLSPEQRKELREKKGFLNNPLYQQAKEMLDHVAVTHHQTNKMRGELHKATFYSKDYG
ncbi:MAG: type II CRISPR RNA-guided endonuclease Cas9, partial [Lentisphaeria bacterium]|nr:type II CRISPR RNA-guided endonuclease Cas9 [Lentisphaeria bacterium]